MSMKTIMDLETFIAEGEYFLQRALLRMRRAGLDIGTCDIDHLCFRVHSEDEYSLYKVLLSEQAVLLTEVPVNGRFIATFKLHQGFRIGDRVVNVVELPAPKKSCTYLTGFEHLEVVISESFETFQAHYPHLLFEPVARKVLNSELCLKVEDFQVKFHHNSLERVIEIEEAELSDIVFDLDGTLVDSLQQILEVNRRVLSEILQRDVTQDEVITNFHSDFKGIFVAFQIVEEAAQRRFIQRWSTLSKEASYFLFEGVMSLLSHCKDQSLRLHLWTARDFESTIHILDALGVVEYFDSMSCANEESSKPQATNFIGSSSREVGAFIMLGDSATDMLAAQNIKAIAAAASWNSVVVHDDLIKAGAEISFKKPTEFLNWLKERW